MSVGLILNYVIGKYKAKPNTLWTTNLVAEAFILTS